MKFTLNWLKDHLETKCSLDEIVSALNSIGLEVSSLKNINKDINKLKVGKVTNIKEHRNADRLKICDVDIGENIIQVICGANNLKLNMMSVFAPVGTYISGLDIILKKTEIRGDVSNGMLCSEKELDISDNHDGIIELSSLSKVGENAASILGIDDPVIEIEITPNRGDCLGVRGIARDLCAYGLGKLKKISTIEEIGEFNSSINWKISLSDEQKYLCPKILGRTFKNLKNGSSPIWLKNRLKSIGMRPISALVDITNYIMVDIGRPLHAYDIKKIKGECLNVRLANNGESFKALNGKTYELSNDMLVICDDDGPDDLAGIMGGERTGIDNATSEMFLEIAIFAPNSISKTGRKLNLNTDARYRFERGLDFDSPEWALNYITKLILKICGGVFSKVEKISQKNDKLKIEFDPNLVSNLIGLEIKVDQILRILLDLGFEIDKINNKKWMIDIPSWRNDIDGKHDIVEEVIRIYGYNHIPMNFLPRHNYITKPSLKNKDRKKLYARKSIASLGYNEVVTFSFLDNEKSKLFNGGSNELKLVNPISSELSEMRPSIIPNLIYAAKKNYNKGISDIAFFEVGPVFSSDSPDGQLDVAAAFKCGNKVNKNWKNKEICFDFYDIKSDVLEILRVLSCPINTLKINNEAPDYFHPGRSASLRLGKKVISFFGELNPNVLNKFNFKMPGFSYEIFLDNIPIPRKKLTSKPLFVPSNFQSVHRDFAFVVDKKIYAKELILIIKNTNKELINKVSVFDIYEGENIPKGKKSIALSVEIQPIQKTLNEKEIDDLSSNIIKNAFENLDAEIRKI